jgi:peptidoglycan/LPS O-acetylase OafA/YrhL
MTAPHPRPRVVEAAFWTWLAAAVLLVLGGLLVAASSAHIPVFIRGAGALFAVAGFATGYLAGRTRQGDKRFRRATVALTLALTVLVTLFALSTLGFLWVLIIVLLITAAVLVMRPAATEWFDANEQAPGGRGD